QLLIPNFYSWSIEQLGGQRAADVISRHAQGHPFRFLGPNGFLFASHGVAFAFTAIGLLCFRTVGTGRHSLTWQGIEYICVIMALLSARSVLPLVVVYVVVLVGRSETWRKRVVTFGAIVLVTVTLAYVAMLSRGGQQL